MVPSVYHWHGIYHQIRYVHNIKKHTHAKSDDVGRGKSYSIGPWSKTHWSYSCCFIKLFSQTGLSPLVPGQWKSLLAAYGGLYAIITLLRPLRVMAAAALSKKTTTLIDLTQDRLGCSRTTAIVVLYSVGFVAWMTTLGCGISLASACSGVPIWWKRKKNIKTR